MLLKTFKSNQPSVLIIIPIITILVWFNPFNNYVPEINTNTYMPLYGQIINYIPEGTIISKILGLILLLSIGLLITRLNTKFIFIPDRSYLPTIIFLILVLGISKSHDLSPILPATLLIIISIEKLLETFKSEQLTYKIFDASMLIGIASLFYFNAIFLIVFIWSTLLIIRPFYLKEWLYSLLGLAVCYFILLGYYYLTDYDFKTLFETINSQFDTKQKFSLNNPQFIFGVASSLVLLISSQYLLKSLSTKKIFTRKTFNLFLVLFLIVIGVFFTIKSASIELITIAAIPISALFSHYFILARSTKWLEIIFLIFLFSFFVTQFSLV